MPSVEHQRLHGESKLNAMRDGLRVLRTIIRERARRDSFLGSPDGWRRPYRELEPGEDVSETTWIETRRHDAHVHATHAPGALAELSAARP